MPFLPGDNGPDKEHFKNGGMNFIKGYDFSYDFETLSYLIRHLTFI
jgi:hypothetical protein